MTLKLWLDRTPTEYLRHVINSIDDQQVREQMRNTAVHFFLEELNVEGEFQIPDEKIAELSRDFFAEICMEVLARENLIKRSKEPMLMRAN